MSELAFKIIIWVSGLGMLGIFIAAVAAHARKRLVEIRCDPPDLVTTKPNRTFPKPLIGAAEKIAREEQIPSDEPPLAVGDECALLGDLSVGDHYLLLVVDADETDVLVSWDDGHQEHRLPRSIVRRPDQPDALGGRKKSKGPQTAPGGAGLAKPLPVS